MLNRLRNDDLPAVVISRDVWFDVLRPRFRIVSLSDAGFFQDVTAGHSDYSAFTMVNCDQVESSAVSAGGRRKSVCAIFAENARLTNRIKPFNSTV